uniref:Torsin-1A n=1 Tax=Aceria tosichella TaxID=561515 RepID=A0A6G1S4U0_9ACAR
MPRLQNYPLPICPDPVNSPTSKYSTFTMIRKVISLSLILLAASHILAVTTWLQAGVCKFKECCHSNDGTGYILYEKGCDNLLDDLKTKVYGQPLIVKPIYKSLKGHMTNDKPVRPLVMYFSGWTGTGKTYVARLIAQNLFKEGMNSKFVKYISSSYHFPMKIEGDVAIAEQRERLRNMIRETVKNCERSLIIMDELDKLPAGVVDALQPLLDYVEDIDGQRYNKAIFIFLSNTGAQRLNKLSYKMFQEGKERKDLSSKDIEEILIEESYEEEGGLRHSNLLKRYSIGVFVPFLPLERLHVKLCIQSEIENSHVIPDNLEQLVEEIADEVAYFPPETEIYSKSGCKGIHDKVINHIGPPIHLNLESMKRSEDKLINMKQEL